MLNGHRFMINYIKQQITNIGFYVYKNAHFYNDKMFLEFSHSFGTPDKEFNNNSFIDNIYVKSSNQENRYLQKEKQMPFHTDSSIIREPHSLILLYCVTKDQSGGGESLLIDSRKVINIIKDDAPKLLKDLCSYEFTFLNSKRKYKAPIINSGGDSYSIRYRKDLISYSSIISVEKFEKEIIEKFENYINRKDIQVNIKLENNDLLIIDNLRILHSRSEIQNRNLSNRHLKRIKII